MTLNDLELKISQYQDFPIKGVLFRDLSPIFKDHMSDFIEFMAELIGGETLKECDYIIGVESRGFIMASALAQKFKKGLVLIRKPGKLPGEVLSESYTLEYGEGELQMHKGSGKAVVVDDVLATGGTLKASLNLSRKAGYEVLDVAVCINLEKLNSFEFNSLPAKALFKYEV